MNTGLEPEHRHSLQQMQATQVASTGPYTSVLIKNQFHRNVIHPVTVFKSMAFIVRLELYTHHQVTVFTFSPFAPKEPCSRQHRSLPTGSSPPSLRQPLPAFLFRCSLSLCMCHANAVIQQTDVWRFAHSQTSQSHSCLFHYSTSCG